jgi:hypothetical protein
MHTGQVDSRLGILTIQNHWFDVSLVGCKQVAQTPGVDEALHTDSKIWLVEEWTLRSLL